MGDSIRALEEAPFGFAVPFIARTTKFELRHNDQTVATRTVSAHAPTVTIISTSRHEVVPGLSVVQWEADDADGDTLSYAVLLSTDNGATWNTAAIGLTTTVYSLHGFALSPNASNWVQVIATDGVNTGLDQQARIGLESSGREEGDEEDGQEALAPRPIWCAGLGGLIALPVFLAAFLGRRSGRSSSRRTSLA